MNQTLEREDLEQQIVKILRDFEEQSKNIQFKKGIYIYGSPGCGKTRFVMDLLQRANFDVVKYDAGDVRNKSLIDTLTSNSISTQNVLTMMQRKTRKLAIVMDEIDGMNNGDKGGISALIKLIRQKKTKKQKQEQMSANPIICIANYYVDKKIKELMKVCHVFELKTPTDTQIGHLIDVHMPNLTSSEYYAKIVQYIQGDLRKYDFIQKIYKSRPDLLCGENIEHIFHAKSFNEDAKRITRTLLNRPIKMEEHNRVLNETDRTTVALLWHENVVDHLAGLPFETSFPLYSKILDNICFADFIYRITFQNQIWQFNEMSSLWKTFYNNRIYHDAIPEAKEQKSEDEVRFTKVLTKYSTEYNNMQFIYELCQVLDLDKKDLFTFFQELRMFYGPTFLGQSDKMNEIETFFEEHAGDTSTTGKNTPSTSGKRINKLDIKRIYRYLDKNVKKDTVFAVDDDDDSSSFDD